MCPLVFGGSPGKLLNGEGMGNRCGGFERAPGITWWVRRSAPRWFCASCAKSREHCLSEILIQRISWVCDRADKAGPVSYTHLDVYKRQWCSGQHRFPPAHKCRPLHKVPLYRPISPCHFPCGNRAHRFSGKPETRSIHSSQAFAPKAESHDSGRNRRQDLPAHSASGQSFA